MARFLSALLSRGLGGQEVADIVALAEAAFAGAPTRSGSDAARRERERLKKQRQRDRKRGMSPGDVPGDTVGTPILTKTRKDIGKGNKEETTCPPVPGDIPLQPVDDWPEDYVEQFWKAFPPFRRQAKAKVAQKLARIRAQAGKQRVTWATLFGGVVKFAATNPGEFAPAPMVWLNDGRWDREYGTGGSNAKTESAIHVGGLSGLGARLRQAVADEQLDFAASGQEPPYRR
jgi:hypothetical protein